MRLIYLRSNVTLSAECLTSSRRRKAYVMSYRKIA